MVRYAHRYADEFDVEVACARNSGGPEGELERYVWEDVTVTSFSPFQDADELERSAKTEALLEKISTRLKPDLVHFHCVQRITASALDVARRCGIPYFVTAHDGWWISDRHFLIDDDGRPVYETQAWGGARRLTRLRTALRHGLATVAVSESLGRLYRARGVDNVIVCPMDPI